MAVYTKHERLPFSCHHQFLPWLLSLLDIRQFSDVMDLEVAPFFFAVFTCVGVHSFGKFASTCVLADERRVVHCAIEDRFAFHVFEAKEPGSPSFSILTRFSNRHRCSTVEHGGNFLHGRLMLAPHGFQETLYPETPESA